MWLCAGWGRVGVHCAQVPTRGGAARAHHPGQLRWICGWYVLSVLNLNAVALPGPEPGYVLSVLNLNAVALPGAEPGYDRVQGLRLPSLGAEKGTVWQ